MSTLIDRLADRFTVQENGCWAWASTNGNGYGIFQNRAAHRVLYETVVGPVERGLDLDHLCRNRRCVNPDHLEPVTRRENLRRGLGLVAEQLSRDCCVRGHPYTPENTYRPARGDRQCRECRRQVDRRRHALKRAAI